MVLSAAVSEGRELRFSAFCLTSGTISEVEVAVTLPEDWQDLLHRLWPADFLKLYGQEG